MMKKPVFYTIIIFLILSTIILYLVIVLSPGVLKFLVSTELSKRLDAKVRVDTLKIISGGKIQISNINIFKKDLYNVFIEQADITSRSFLTFLNGTPIKCHFTNFKIAHKNLAIINSIASVLSMQPLEAIDFGDISFEISLKEGQFIFKNLNAQGDIIKVSANGTIGKGDNINYSLKLFLSKMLTEQIPQNVKEFLLKETDGWSEIDLYVSGTNKKPMINLSTSLFKLILH